ncbi:MAG: adenylate/guanylate cyclase domain-containing protein [Flavobacteriales bacterium]
MLPFKRLPLVAMAVWHGRVAAQQFDIRVFGVEDGLPSATVDAIREDSSGYLWVSTADGLCRFDGRHFDQWLSGMPAPPVELDAVLDTVDSTYSIACKNNGKPLSGVDPQAWTSDGHGNTWEGHADGAWRFGKGPVLHLSAANGLGHSDVQCLHCDRSGAIWIGTAFGGLARFTGDACINYTERDGLNARTVSAIHRTPDGTLWIGTSGGGVARWDSTGARTLGKRDGLEEGYVTCLAQDVDGTLLLGTVAHGLFRWNGTRFERPVWAGAVNNTRVNRIRLGADSLLWVAAEAGLFSRSPNGALTRWNNYTEAVTDVLVDGGHIWIGREDGLSYQVNGRAVSYRDRDRDFPAGVQVNALAHDASGNLWAATDGSGLWRIADAGLKQFTAEQGLSSDRVEQVLLDADDNVWVGTARGFDMLEFDVLQEHLLNVRHYGTDDGFIGSEAFRNACFLDRDSTLWFGTVNGATRFDPDRVVTIEASPRTRITSLLLNYEVPDWTPWSSGISGDGLPKDLVLPFNKNHLTFGFVGLSLANPDKVRYRFKLDGHDPDWSPVSSEQRVTYNNLAPGTYTFNVLARNASGIWNEEPTTFTFTIEPPLWKTAGFLSITGASLLLALYGLVRLRTRRLRLAAEQLESMVEERTRELADEKHRSEELLLNILPARTAAELKAKGRADAHRYEHATVLFSDFKGFTGFSEGMASDKLVAELDRFFRAFDRLCDTYRMEKIKTIGDAYMCVAGVPNEDADHAMNATRMALAMLSEVQRINAERALEGQEAWPIRIGLHSGPLTAGVVGEKKFAFDIWGGTVNLASRMESSGEAGHVNCSGATYALIMDRMRCIPRGPVRVKGKGEVHMYFVEGLREMKA